MSQPASRRLLPGIWPAQKPSKEALTTSQRTVTRLINRKTQCIKTLNKIYTDHQRKGPKIVMGSSSTVFLYQPYRLVKETSALTFLSLLSQLLSLQLCVRLGSESALVVAMGEFLMPKDKDRASIFSTCPTANWSLNPWERAVKAVTGAS